MQYTVDGNVGDATTTMRIDAFIQDGGLGCNRNLGILPDSQEFSTIRTNDGDLAD
jgi:hypothetical protein